MPKPAYYVDIACEDVSEELVASLFKQAENAIKTIERTQSELTIPAVNQLRYAGAHLSRYITNKEPGSVEARHELLKASNHCQRAIYDSCEGGILYYLIEVKQFESDYRHVIISEVITDWHSIKLEISKIREHLQGADSSAAGIALDELLSYFNYLDDLINKLSIYRDELNKCIRRERRQSIIFVATILGVILTAITVYIA